VIHFVNQSMNIISASNVLEATKYVKVKINKPCKMEMAYAKDVP